MQRIGIAALSVVVALFISSCGAGSTKDKSQSSQDPSDPGLIHIHGLGIDPADESLFIATHSGVWRLPPDSDEAARVSNRFQDTMGFAVVGPNHFIGSGHPDFGEKLPPFLGFIESTDAARSWRKVSLLGQADFHVLEASGPRVYGFGSDFESRSEQLLVSDDHGRTWTAREFPESFSSLAIDPNDPDTALASGIEELHLTVNGGRSWSQVEGRPGLLAWTDTGIFRVDDRGSVASSGAPNGSWAEISKIDSAPAAVDSHENTLLVARHDSTILQSTNGKSWSLRYSPQP